jgi:ribulose-phosphate 3-epimerase
MVSEVRITPSILNADFSRLNSEIEKISNVADLLHLDVMDNVFVPNFTFDFEAASKIVKESQLPVDAHLMVADVDEIAVQYAEIGCASVTIHAEATRNIGQTLRNIRSAGSRASLGSWHKYSSWLVGGSKKWLVSISTWRYSTSRTLAH